MRPAVIILLAGVLGGCATGAPGAVATTPSPSRPLADRLLRAGNLPPALSGFIVQPIAAASSAPLAASPDVSPRADRSCGAKLIQGAFARLVAPPTDLAVSTLNGRLGDDIWIGSETAESYPPGNATATMTQIRRVAASCRDFTATDRLGLSGTVDEQDVPGLGDDALILSIKAGNMFGSSDERTLVARVGDALVVVTVLGAMDGLSDDVLTVGRAAVEAFT